MTLGFGVFRLLSMRDPRHLQTSRCIPGRKTTAKAFSTRDGCRRQHPRICPRLAGLPDERHQHRTPLLGHAAGTAARLSAAPCLVSLEVIAIRAGEELLPPKPIDGDENDVPRRRLRVPTAVTTASKARRTTG